MKEWEFFYFCLILKEKPENFKLIKKINLDRL